MATCERTSRHDTTKFLGGLSEKTGLKTMDSREDKYSSTERSRGNLPETMAMAIISV